MAPNPLLEKAAQAYLGNDLGRTIGPFLLGSLFDFVLFGTLLHQLIIWGSQAKSDRLLVKAIVGWSTLVSVATTGYAFYFVWRNFVVHFGEYANWLVFGRLTWYALMAALTTLPSHIFYAERAYKLLKKRWWVPASIAPFAGASLGGAIAVCCYGNNMPTLAPILQVQHAFYIWIGSTMAADILVTGYILYGLSKAKTGWSDTDHIVNKLYKITLESQLPPTLIAVAFMVNYARNADDTINGIFFVHSKVYIVCLLGIATLNSRVTMRRDLGSEDQKMSEPRTHSHPLSERHQQKTVDMGSNAAESIQSRQELETPHVGDAAGVADDSYAFTVRAV